MRSKDLVIILVFIISLYSCKKDELTLPSDVTFTFGIVPHYSYYAKNQTFGFTNLSSGFLNIDKGTLVIDAIEFDGKRNEGKDIYFTSNFGSQVLANLGNQTTNINVSFDIPQGAYNRIDITLHLGTSSQVSIAIEGTMSAGVFSSLPIRFEYNFTDQVKVRATPKTGNSIVLRKDKPSIAQVLVNAEYLFRFVNPSILSNATIVNIDGDDILLINSQNNINIFNQIANRLDNSFTVVFE